MKVIRNRDDLEQVAIDLVRGDYMIPSDDNAWDGFFLLYGDTLRSFRNLGCVLIPVRPHLGGRWVNGRAPGVVVECLPINKGDTKRLDRLWKAKHIALYGEPDNQQGATP